MLKEEYLSELPYRQPEKAHLVHQHPELTELPLTELKKKLKVRQNLLFSQRAKIVSLYFQHSFTAKKIAETIGVHISTVKMVIHRHRKNERDLAVVVPHRRGRVPKINGEIKAFLLSHDCLDSWKTISLQRRVQLVHQQFGLQICSKTLANLYHANRVSFTAMQRTIKVSGTPTKQLNDRIMFARAALEMMNAGKEMWYFDETSFNLWDTRHRIWQSRDDKLDVVLAKSRGSGFTVLGAISNRRDVLCRSVASTTNLQHVNQYWDSFAQHYSLNDVVIVLDNHPCHWNSELRFKLQQAGAHILFLPASSSFLNPVEQAWAWIKFQWRNSVTNLNGDNPNLQSCMEEVQRICSSAPEQMFTRIAQGAVRLYEEWAAKELVRE